MQDTLKRILNIWSYLSYLFWKLKSDDGGIPPF
jgi:hypothetical protein